MPTLHDIQQVDPILTNFALEYKNDDYIAERVAPIILSKKLTGKYYKFDTANLRVSRSLRAPGSLTATVDYSLSASSAYTILDHALKAKVPIEDIEESPSPLDPMKDATERVIEKLLVEKEYDLATYMQNTSNLTNNTTLSGTDQWSDYANSDPFDDIQTGQQTVHSKTGKVANVLVLGKQTYDKLKHHPDVIDRLKYGGRADFKGVVTPQMLADAFDIDTVLIGSALYESAVEGQTSSLAYIWRKHAWVLYTQPKPSKRGITFMYHFQKKKARVVDKWWDKDRESWFVRVHDKYTRELISVNCAYLIKNAVA